ncbi:MAG TPA: uroporphyrinogen-III synthase [Hyphomicrobiales bacterium]|nr:uroporphyrinogen-III synthase [Hyphomicrobiales bacterium]
MQVAVLRPADAAARTAAKLRALGFAPLVAPLTAIVAAPPPRLAARDFAGIVVTSANAIEAVAAHPDLALFAGLPAWTVGAHSAAVARRHGFVDVRAGGGDAAALAAQLERAGERGRPYLWLAGEDVAADLAALLAPAGIAIERCVVYRAAAAAVLPRVLADALGAGTLGAALHYSPRGATLYRDLAAAAGLAEAALAVRNLCLAERVAASLRAAGARAIEVAERPEEAALLALLGSPSPARAAR